MPVNQIKSIFKFTEVLKIADTSFKKLSNSISVSDKDKSLILVNNEWTFKLPDDIEYKLDTEFDGGYNVGVDFSGDIKTMILKGMKTGTVYKFNVSLSPHYDIFHKFYTVDECRNDNREEDDEFSGIFARASVIDEKNIYVDMTSTNQWPLGQELVIRVRGDKIQPIDFFTVLKNYTEDDFNNVATKLIDIAESVKIYKKPAAKKTKAPDVEATLNSDIQKTTKTKNKTEKDCFSARAVMKKCQWSIGVPEGFEFSNDLKKNGVSQTTGNKYELIIAKPEPGKKVNFKDPYDNKMVFVTTHHGDSGLNGTSLDSAVSEMILNSNVNLYSFGDWITIIKSPLLRAYYQPSFANLFYGDEVHNLDVLIITPFKWTACTFLFSKKNKKEEQQGEKLLKEMLHTILTPEISDYWDDSGFVNSAKTEKQDITTVNTISSEPDTAIPDIELYPHYANVADKSSGSLGITVVHSTRGTQFDCRPVKGLLKNEKAEKRILDADQDNYALGEYGRRFSSVFNVSKKAFDSENDRENDILKANLKKIEPLHVLRSFAWSLKSYCEKAEKEIKDITIDEVQFICKHIEHCNYLNYEADSHFSTLCGIQDLHVAFLPEDVSQDDKNIFLPSEEDIEYHNSMKAKFPNFKEILTVIGSLSGLRKDLADLLPVMEGINDELTASRNYDIMPEGTLADVLYAWSSLTIAAEGPFFTEDGPMFCSYSWQGKTLNVSKTAKKGTSATNTTIKEKSEDRSFYNADIYNMFECYDIPDTRIKLLNQLRYREKLENPAGCDLMIKKFVRPEEEVLKEKAYMQYSKDSDENVKKYYEIRSAAIEFAKVFRVNPDVFNPGCDTESEIHAGYIKHISAIHALKSLATMVYPYAKKVNKNYFDITLEEIFNMIYLIEDCGGSNFKPQAAKGAHWLDCIRNVAEVKYKYCCFDSEKPFKTEYMKKDFTLAGLINNLHALMPIMQKIYFHLSENRDRSVYLNDALSRLLSAWCTYALAVDSQFEIAKGIDTYTLKQCDDSVFDDEPIIFNTTEDGIVYCNDIMLDYTGNNKKLTIPGYIRCFPSEYNPFGIAEHIVYESAETNICWLNASDIITVEVAKDAVVFDYRFARNNVITNVVFPEGLQEIGDCVFYDCSALKNVNIPDSVKKIGIAAFTLCRNLEITIPASVKEISSSPNARKCFTDLKKVKAYRDSYAAKWLERERIPFETILSEEQKEADRQKAIREAEERERRRREEEDRRRLEAERKRREEEARIAEEKRIAAQRKSEFDRLTEEKEEQLKIIEENKGIFGQKAKNRKEAKKKLEEILLELEKYPEFKKE